MATENDGRLRIENPAVGDGFWVYLDDLEAGDHVIHFYMELTSGSFVRAPHDVTWHAKITDED